MKCEVGCTALFHMQFVKFSSNFMVRRRHMVRAPAVKFLDSGFAAPLIFKLGCSVSFLHNIS